MGGYTFPAAWKDRDERVGGQRLNGITLRPEAGFEREPGHRKLDIALVELIRQQGVIAFPDLEGDLRILLPKDMDALRQERNTGDDGTDGACRGFPRGSPLPRLAFH